MSTAWKVCDPLAAVCSGSVTPTHFDATCATQRPSSGTRFSESARSCVSVASAPASVGGSGALVTVAPPGALPLAGFEADADTDAVVELAAVAWPAVVFDRCHRNQPTLAPAI